ncbi:hypothetical protein WNY37_14740 [Henriciella sp. AS95]|uniref:hypothetical protein n=1 Tax=Henriciella sp. AS95 TaxID=3135782 RepID=UPI00317CDDDC
MPRRRPGSNHEGGRRLRLDAISFTTKAAGAPPAPTQKHPPPGAPAYTPRMLDLHTAACLEKNWTVLTGLLGLIQRLVNAPVFTQKLKRRVCGLLRIAESFARRLLVIRASALVMAAPAPQRASANPQIAPARPRTTVTLPLVEALPRFPDPDEMSGPCGAPPAPVADDTPADPARAIARLAALCRILDNADHHARRMARYLRQLKARTGRYHPFSLRRPPGTSRHPADAALDSQLRDADFFARRVLDPAPG